MVGSHLDMSGHTCRPLTSSSEYPNIILFLAVRRLGTPLRSILAMLVTIVRYDPEALQVPR